MFENQIGGTVNVTVHEEDQENEEEEEKNIVINNNLCKYCLEACDVYINPALRCSECSKKVHVRCLKRGGVPGALVGDVFFNFICAECSPVPQEIINRRKLSWLNIIILALHNLKEKSSGISKRGYFHWKSDISTFVDKHWDDLFAKAVKKKKNWVGTISGTLSHYSATFFKSGTGELGESGWWKLFDPDPPEVLMDKNNQIILERKKSLVSLKGPQDPVNHFGPFKGSNAINPSKGANSMNPFKGSNSLYPFKGSNSLNPFKGSNPLNPGKVLNSPSRSESSSSFGEDSYPGAESSSRTQTPSMFSREYVQPSEVLSDFLLADDDVSDVELLNIDEGLEMQDQSDSLSPVDLLKDLEKFSKDSDSQICQLLSTFNPDWMQNILNSENFDEMADKEKFDDEEQYEEMSSDGFVAQEPLNSLFHITSKRDWPWKTPIKPTDRKRSKMGKYEEDYLIQSVNKAHLDSMSPSLRRLYRKLIVRKLKRENNLPLFDIDTFGVKAEIQRNSDANHRVIDRFYNDNFNPLFEQRLSGYVEPTAVHSPYTNRILKPFIRRDYSCRSLWSKVMLELTAKSNKNLNLKEDPASIDYCYVRPQHIPAINSLCSLFFWPGIDLTECLQYPDFTCVVLYKKLIIGFAVLVPDVGYNEAYISFFLTRPEWRKCGIGTFMLYHLIQSCMGKDITLHVSATNAALILYQKFGFKIEEFVQDFYDKYMMSGPRESRHALFLRLSR